MRGLFLILVFIISTYNLHGQYNCIFQHYSTRDGLSHGQVRTMLKDSKGFMWFGTFDGIDKFDGFRFTTYKTRPGDNASLSSNRIDRLMEDKWGFLWIQTYDSKVYRFDKRSETFESVLLDSSCNEIKVDRIFKSSIGDFWLYSGIHGLFRLITDPNDFHLKIIKYNVFKNNPNENRDIKLVFINEDAQHQIWFGSEKDLVCLKLNKADNQYQINNNASEAISLTKRYHLSSIAEQSNKMWIGTVEGVLLSIDLNTLKSDSIVFKNSSAINILKSRFEPNLYIGTNGNGIFLYNTEQHAIEGHITNPLLQNIQYIFIDSHHLLWIETDKEGIIKTNSVFGNLRHFSQKTDADPSLQVRTTSSFFEDKNHVLWIALKEGGFGYYNRATDNFDYFYNEPGNPDSKMSNYVNSFYMDSTNVIWLCTYFRGLEKITILQGGFQFMKLNPSSSNRISNEVRSVFEDSRGILWIGTKDGQVHLLDKNNHILKEYADEIDHGMVYSICEDHTGNIWLGTKGNGLFKAQRTSKSLTDYTFTQYRHHPNDSRSLSSDMIYSVLEDSNERIWVGTFGEGLNLLVSENGHTYFKNSQNSFKNYPENIGSRIRYLQQDSRGNIWIASTEGLILFNPDENTPDNLTFHHYSKIPGDPSSLGNNDILYIFKDAVDTLWLGTLGGGLHKMISYPEEDLPPKFKIYTKTDGLPSDVILSIEEDNQHNLWLATENGISGFNIQRQVFRHYDEYNGIEKSTFSEATSCQRTSGEIYFGSLDGVYYFDPNRVGERTIQGNMVLTNLRLFNQDVYPGGKNSPLKEAISETSSIHLKYNQNMFSIEYVALDYEAQDKIEYAFELEGFDPEESGWHFVKNQRIATYTNIPPGKYTFKVKYVNHDSEFNETDASLKITILPPPWKTGWAYAGYILLLLIILEITRRIIFTMIRLRNKVVIEKEMTDLKLRFFTNISHELRTPLTLILGPVDELTHTEKLTERGKEHIQLIEHNAKRMLKLINQLLDFRKIQNKKMVLKLTHVDIVILIKEICANFKDIAEEKQIEFIVNSNIESLSVWIDEEKMDIVIFNLLSNAFKFTPSSRQIELNIIYQKHQNFVVIEVKDQGIGIPKEKASMVFNRFADIHDSTHYRDVGTGIGLSLSKELIELHNGTIGFESTEGVGTTFRIELKLGKDHFNEEWVEFIEDAQPCRKKIEEPEKLDFSYENHISINGSSSEHEKPVVLIVEDNADVRKFISGLISDLYITEEATDGVEGFEKAIQLTPDIIISDVMMPRMDGIELISKLKNDFATSHIPVILLTAKSSVESKVEGLKYGADAYITKPFNSLLLKAQIQNLLDQRILLIEKFINRLKLLDIQEEKGAVITDRDSDFLETIVQIVENNISNSEFKIENIAKSVGLGRTSFFKKLKGLTGMSPIDFVSEFRLRKALKLLESGKYNISEVSYMTGFNDPGYFSKRFKERFKKAPSSYIRQN